MSRSGSSIGSLSIFCLFVIIGCDRGPLEFGAAGGRPAALENDPDILNLSVTDEPLEGVVAIPRSEFETLLKEGVTPLEEKQRYTVAQLSALANARQALGVTGDYRENVALDGRWVVILENPREADGVWQATRFTFLAGVVRGTSAWGLENLRLQFNDTPGQGCESPRQGCRPVLNEGLVPLTFANEHGPGGGLFAGARLDAESPTAPTNALGNSIEFASYSWPENNPSPNRFVCAGDVMTANCPPAPLQGAPLKTRTVGEMALSLNAALVSEEDFDQFLLSGSAPVDFPNLELNQQIAELVVAANSPRAIGVVALGESSGTTEADVLLVARDLWLSPGRIEAESFFVVPGPLQIDAKLTGLDISLLFDVPVPTVDWGAGVCGPVLLPDSKFPGPDVFTRMRYAAPQGGYGTDRYPFEPRTTLRWPTKLNGFHEVQVLACSIYEPPTPQIVPRCDSLSVAEVCNGVDDNCDGRIDELGCDVIQCTGSCTPHTCGSYRCVTIPDGCGSVLSCPCP